MKYRTWPLKIYQDSSGYISIPYKVKTSHLECDQGMDGMGLNWMKDELLQAC
ncbi:hypothetical protein GY45DRAFT_1330527, partial [Cubamyces sp. BRFM 1775]